MAKSVHTATDESRQMQRGAEWHRWDLHIHTPASLEQHFGSADNEDTWEAYLCDLEELPASVRAIGINDYFLIDGYRRVVEAKAAGRLQNIELILPVVELRLNVLVGHSKTKKINYHVLFSDELRANDIELFFLQRLRAEVNLGGRKWRGCLGHREGLIELGREVKAAVPAGKAPNETDLRVGFASAAVSLESVIELLEESVFVGKHLKAVGLGEWGQMRWDGAGGPQKRSIIQGVDFVLTASPTLDDYHRRRAKLIDQGVNSHLVHASDAHYLSTSTEPNRVGTSLAWIKADLTFRGLCRAVRRFEERVFVGRIPPKLEHIRSNRTRYIESIEIGRQQGSDLSENWFDVKVPLNPGLVAIIGNQGMGKSALADAVALCGDSVVDDFSFLTPDKFCDRENRAASFEATLTWMGGGSVTRSLSSVGHREGVERVRYVPQGFFERVTNETTVHTSSAFYSEI